MATLDSEPRIITYGSGATFLMKIRVSSISPGVFASDNTSVIEYVNASGEDRRMTVPSSCLDVRNKTIDAHVIKIRKRVATVRIGWSVDEIEEGNLLP